MFYCNKCNSIPLILIVPKLDGSYVLKKCFCGEQKLNLFQLNKEKNENNTIKNIKKNGELTKEEIKILKNDYLKAYNKLNTINNNLKKCFIEQLNQMINNIENLYKKNLEENLKILDLINSFFIQYEKLQDKKSQKNILLNTSFNLDDFIFSKDENFLINYFSFENYLKTNLIIFH